MDAKKESSNEQEAKVDGGTKSEEETIKEVDEETNKMSSKSSPGDNTTDSKSMSQEDAQAPAEKEQTAPTSEEGVTPTEYSEVQESEEATTDAVGEQRDTSGVTHEEESLMEEETMDEVVDEHDIERSQMSSGSEDEDVRQARKLALQHMQTVMTKPSDIQDPNKPRITRDEDKERMEAHARSKRDKAILQSMAVAERGYITRLRPPSVPTDKLTLSQYQIRPGLEEKFKSMVVKEMIHTVLNDELGGKVYTEEDAKAWSQSIANTIRLKVKEMGFPRYKFVVQCVIGEEHGAGVKIGSRCLWDADTDNYASDTFLNETIFCMTAVYAIYFY